MPSILFELQEQPLELALGSSCQDPAGHGAPKANPLARLFMDRNQFNEVYHNGFWVQDDLDMAKFRDAAPCGTALPKAQGTKPAEDAASG